MKTIYSVQMTMKCESNSIFTSDNETEARKFFDNESQKLTKKSTTMNYFAVYKGEVIAVTHTKKRWYKNVQNGADLLISDRNIFKTQRSAEQSLSARIQAKKDKEKRQREEYLAEEQRRDHIFRENPWLLEEEAPCAFMLADDLEEYVRRFKKNNSELNVANE